MRNVIKTFDLFHRFQVDKRVAEIRKLDINIYNNNMQKKNNGTDNHVRMWGKKGIAIHSTGAEGEKALHKLCLFYHQTCCCCCSVK